MSKDLFKEKQKARERTREKKKHDFHSLLKTPKQSNYNKKREYFAVNLIDKYTSS